jgi:hypothetical protein
MKVKEWWCSDSNACGDWIAEAAVARRRSYLKEIDDVGVKMGVASLTDVQRKVGAEREKQKVSDHRGFPLGAQ